MTGEGIKDRRRIWFQGGGRWQMAQVQYSELLDDDNRYYADG